MIDAKTSERLYNFLKPLRYGVISTISGNGAPEAALIGLAAMPDLCLIFETLNTTRKYHNLRRDPRVALVVGWENEKTLQYEGEASEPDEEDAEPFKKAYYDARPENRDHDGWPGLTYMYVRPRWIRISNYGMPWSVEEFHFDR